MKEYIYLHNMVWFADEVMKRANGYNDIAMNRGTIMTDLVEVDSSTYYFVWKVTGIRLQTHYAWALAENTPENVKNIKKYDDAKEKLKEMERKCNGLYNRIVTLKAPKELDPNEKTDSI